MSYFITASMVLYATYHDVYDFFMKPLTLLEIKNISLVSSWTSAMPLTEIIME